MKKVIGNRLDQATPVPKMSDKATAMQNTLERSITDPKTSDKKVKTVSKLSDNTTTGPKMSDQATSVPDKTDKATTPPNTLDRATNMSSRSKTTSTTETSAPSTSHNGDSAPGEVNGQCETKKPEPEVKENKVDRDIPLSNYLEIFFATAYFLCLSPFRVKRGKEEKGSSKPFVIQTFLPQKILCAVLTLLSLFWFLREIRITVPSGKSPAGYVQLVLSIVTTMIKLFIFGSLWFNQQRFLAIVNFVADQFTRMKFARKRFLLAVAAVYTVMGLVLFFLIRGEFLSGGIIEDWTWERWIHSLTYAGRYNFFISQRPFPGLCNNTMRVYLDSSVKNYMQSVDTLLVILAMLGSFWRHMQGPFCDFLLLMTVLTLWTATKQFCDKVKAAARKREKKIEAVLEENDKDNADVNSMEKNKHESPSASDMDVVIKIERPAAEVNAEWKEIYRGFRYLKKLSDLINKTLGFYVTGSIVEDVLYYAVFFDLVFAEEDATKDWGRRIALLFFVLSTCVTLLLCADLSHRMSALKSWLFVEENRAVVPTDLLLLLVNQVDNKRVSISGSRIFPITYQTLCAMAGVTGTYFILCVKDKHLVTERLQC